MPDLAAAADAARQLGFAVTGRGVHAGRGTSNRLIMFPGCYWEFLSVDRPLAVNRSVHQRASRPGVAGCAVATRDIGEDRRRAEERGIIVGQPIDISRPLPGTGETARFQIAEMGGSHSFDGFLFYCQHLTPGLVWRDAWPGHPAGARFVSRIDVASDTPADTAARLAAVFGTRARTCAERIVLGLPNLALEVTTGAYLARQFPGSRSMKTGSGRMSAIHFAVTDLDRAAEIVGSAGIGTGHHDGGFFVELEPLGDTIIAFEQHRRRDA